MRLIADVPLGAFLSAALIRARSSPHVAPHGSPVRLFPSSSRRQRQRVKTRASRRFISARSLTVHRPPTLRGRRRLVCTSTSPSRLLRDPDLHGLELARSTSSRAFGRRRRRAFRGYTRYVVTADEAFARLPRILRQGLMQPLGRRLPHGALPTKHNPQRPPSIALDRYIEDLVFTKLNNIRLHGGLSPSARGARRRAIVR